ncbi:MAG: nucleoside 2-deoxyribosyltransferase [Candidatus Paceibacterota bacterium]|jgi:nucleoside 2-deoxyribosyltransferase
MKAYLVIKFKEDNSNRKTIEDISAVLEKIGMETTVMTRDYEKWGEVRFTPLELMQKTFQIIDSSDLLIVEFSEKGVGIGIEAGYAYAKNKPIYVILKEGSDVSNTLRGIAKDVIFYNNPEELIDKLKI